MLGIYIASSSMVCFHKRILPKAPQPLNCMAVTVSTTLTFCTASRFNRSITCNVSSVSWSPCHDNTRNTSCFPTTSPSAKGHTYHRNLSEPHSMFRLAHRHVIAPHTYQLAQALVHPSPAPPESIHIYTSRAQSNPRPSTHPSNLSFHARHQSVEPQVPHPLPSRSRVNLSRPSQHSTAQHSTAQHSTAQHSTQGPQCLRRMYVDMYVPMYLCMPPTGPFNPQHHRHHSPLPPLSIQSCLLQRGGPAVRKFTHSSR